MTFKHLHTLSLDWHLKKKIGHVLRIMDRGIRSADSVMNYLVLYLIPSIIECMVTFTIFYIKFKSPKLAVIGFLCFVVYVVITIQITIWRKQYRRRSNAPQIDPCGSQIAPKSIPNDAKSAQEAQEMSRRRPGAFKRHPKSAPERPKDVQKMAQSQNGALETPKSNVDAIF